MASTSLRKFSAALHEFRKLDGQMPAQVIDMLLVLFEDPAAIISMGELANKSGMSQAATSRNVDTICKGFRHGGVGYGLAEAFEDPLNRRQKLIKLTHRGKLVAASIIAILEGLNDGNDKGGT